MEKKRKVPVYRQLESTDCGPTCVKMVATYYGKQYSLRYLKDLCDITRIGASAADIVTCCRGIGFNVHTVNINSSELHRIPCPAILYYKAGHFVVLDGIKKRKANFKYNIIDPGFGRVVIDEDLLYEKLMMEGQALAIVLEPSENFYGLHPSEDPADQKFRRICKSVKGFYREYQVKILKITALTGLTLASSWAMPLILKKTIDEGIGNKDLNLVWLLLLAQLLFFIGHIVTNNITYLLIAKMGYKADIDLSSKYLNKLISLPIIFFDSRFRSDYIHRLEDQRRIRRFLTESVYGMALTFLNILVFSTILVVYNYKIFLMFFCFSGLAFIYNSFFLKRRKYIDYSLFSLDSQGKNSIYELVMGMPEIKINNAECTRVSAWERIQQKVNKLQLEALLLNYYMTGGATFFNKLRDIVITGLCAFLVISNKMTLGVMMMISYLLGQLSGPINNTISYASTIQDTKLANDRLAEVYDRPEEEIHEKKAIRENHTCRGVTVKKVSFKYSGNYSPLVLDNINLDIPVGKVTAIVGASGSGKTTLLKLLLGFYPTTSGTIEIDDTDMSTINLKSWRNQCGVVMQDGYIYSGTIAENIAMADELPDIDKKRLDESLKIACLDKKVNSLPMGVMTMIGEYGISLSGGEKQRLFIARAVYKNPEFIFLDEATSHLDANNEREIIRNLDRFFVGKTVVIIAHRLSTVQNADNIVFIENGKIAEQGTHTELTNKKGSYYKLVKNQLELGI